MTDRQTEAGKVVRQEFERVSRSDMTEREIQAFDKLENARKSLSKSENIDRLGKAALKVAMNYHSTTDLLPAPFNIHERHHELWSSMRPIDGAETLIARNMDEDIIKGLDDTELERVLEHVAWRLREMDMRGVLDHVEIKGREVPFTASETAIYLKRETSERILFGNFTFVEYVSMLLKSWAPLNDESIEDKGEVL